MSRNLPGTPGYSLPDAARKRPRGPVTMARDTWATLDAEAHRRGVSRGILLEEALAVYLPTSRALPAADGASEKST